MFWSFSAVVSGIFCAFSATIPRFIHSRLSTGFPHVLRFSVSFGSFSLASPFVPVGDFVTCFCFFFFLVYIIFIFVCFLPSFFTGLLLCGCYI